LQSHHSSSIKIIEDGVLADCSINGYKDSGVETEKMQKTRAVLRRFADQMQYIQFD
jgi:hypothetical protein